MTTFGKLKVGDYYTYIREGTVFCKVAEGRCRLAAHPSAGSEYEVKSTEVYKLPRH
jgi:hypothetical protein